MKLFLRATALFLLLFAAGATANAQERTVTGTVVDETDNPLPGVNVLIKGTTTGTITDIDGNFRINVPGNATLVFSYIGYIAVEKSASATTISVALEPDMQQLQEVVVVAYGEQTRKSLTGAVGVVDGDVVKNQQVVTVGQALQGTTPGVNIINNTGQPGDNPTIRIRGVSSVNASASPLIVVDGVVFQGNLSAINPNDIASFNILKDASASALYGSRAANGVIMINTRTGKAGETRIELNTSFGISHRAVPEYNFTGAADYMKLAWEAARFEAEDINADNPGTIANPGQYASDKLTALDYLAYNPYGVANPIGPDGELVPGAELLWETDWEDAVTRDQAARQDISLSISGGNDKTRYFFSGSYLNQEGITITSSFERFAGRLNLETDLKDWLRAGMRTSISYSTQNYPGQSGNSFSNNIQYIRSMASIYPVYQRDASGDLILDENGEAVYDFGIKDNNRNVNTQRPVLNPSNLVATTRLNEYQRERFYSSVNAYLEGDITKELSFRTNFAVDSYLFDRFDYDNPENGAGENVNGRVQRQKNITNYWTWNNQLTYDKSFGEHNLNVTALAEMYNYKYEFLNAQKTGFPFIGLTEFNSGATLEDISGYTDHERLLSYMGRVSYNFRNRYFIELASRSDQSSRFAEDERTGIFSSVGLSWVISDEAFMPGFGGNLSFLKLRASYGEVGNNFLQDEAGDPMYFPYLNAFATGYDDLGNSGIFLNALANPFITWETVNTLNVGADFGLFNDKLTGTVEWYQKTTEDLLFLRPLPPSVGVPSIPENSGSIRNRGVEVSLSSVNFKSPSFRWQTDFNIAFENNEIVELSQDEIIDGSKKLMVGKSIYDFFIQDWAGVDPQDGMAMWYRDVTDAEGNVTGRETTKNYDEATRYYQGSALADARGGVFNKLNYKGIEFSFLISYSLGGKVLDNDYAGLMHGMNRPGYQMHADILNRWQQPGDITDVPRLNTGNSDVTQRSSRFLYNNSYMRLRNVTLAYNFGPQLLQKLNIRTLRVFAQADNYLTLSNRDGLDPEQNIQGTTDNRSSIFKTLSMGLNVGL